ncbi:hypothetical protein J4E90_000195 [Alternaria incomplexa]|uniref:uncharacterized protein n=1 Tax=Alternaria incomplexa TaxID=1187928 RepID=UPI00221F8E75|nr:uncharacterized protein J4E90_000195 [Alternaria incomplexa]KAI4921768.1 hypothetical protein J4E90_000195 [Alternaria incomplexa]
MADRRSVRSASRRKTPTPQPPANAPAQQFGRAPRARSLRSASREVEDFIDIQKPTRRSARQASVTTNDGSEHEAPKARNTKRKPAKELLGDLTVVEEIDTEIALEEDEVPGTPARTEPDVTFRSPGAASEMSGTTAITSFSMIEAEFLEPRYIVKHLRKLCEATEDFLEHIAPNHAAIEDDLQNIQEMRKPGSVYSKDYQDFEDELNTQLKHYKGEEHSYIHIRAIHRALFGTSEDVTASQSGLDLILYLTNLLVLAKQIMHSDRDDKSMWDVLRQLDISFPTQFMQSLDPDAQQSAAGESALYDQTFELALELRTQLAILVLQKSTDNPSFDPTETMEEVFFRSDSSQSVEAGSPIRGWSTAALGGDESALPEEFEDQIVTRVDQIRASFFWDGQDSQAVDLQRLRSDFPWEATVLRLLDWVRLRHKELKTAIDNLGGPNTIMRNLKEALEEPQHVTQTAPSAPRESLRRKRTSFGRDRRRSSRKFDPNAKVDLRAIDVLKEKERDSDVHLGLAASQPDREETLVQQSVEEVENEQPGMNDQPQDEQQTMVGSDTASQQEHEDIPQAIEKVQNEQPRTEHQQDNMQVVDESDVPQQPDEEQSEQQQTRQQTTEESRMEEPEEPVEAQFEAPQASGPPQSSAALLKALKAVPKPQKENRPVSIFDRQPTAQRIEFGDGFDSTQPTPGPSNTAKGKQPALPSPRKRKRVIDISDSESDEFETADRGFRAPERRRNAPVSKKQRTAERIPSSSAAPTSHQPPRPESEQEESISETSAPSMSEEPPSSTWPDQRRLAKENRALEVTTQERAAERKGRQKWTDDEEDALIQYMNMYRGKYSKILQHDQDDHGPKRLINRNQVNLKDKARTMALHMIRSGAGLRPGFEMIIHPGMKEGKALMAAGWVMHEDGSWERAAR